MAARHSRTDAAEGGAARTRARAFVRVAWPVLLVLGLVVLFAPLVASV